jgi:alpha-1,2-mannosyltransferase
MPTSTVPVTRSRAVIPVLAALALVAAAWLTVRSHGFADLAVRQDALRWWLDGNDLYLYADPASGTRFSATPFAAMLLAPLAVLPLPVAGWLMLAVGVAVLALVFGALLAPMAGRYGWPRWRAVAVAVPLAMATGPVREVLGTGELDLIVFGLIVADLVALRRRNRAAVRGGPAWRDSPGFRHLRRDGTAGWGRFKQGGGWAGVGIGLAAAIKITPLLFVAYLLITRQWRAARTALITFLAATGLAALLARTESLAYLSRVFWQPSRVATADDPGNLSVAGLFARLYHSSDTPTLLWLAFSLVLVALGLTRASRAHADGDELAALTLVGSSAALAAPLTFAHQLLFLLPAVLVLADLALRERDAGRSRRRFVVPAVGAVLLLAALVAGPVRGTVAANAAALLLIALVTMLPWRPEAEPAFAPRPWTLSPRPRKPVRGS